MARISTHVRETASRDMVRLMIDTYYENGDALVREWAERDYGIDFVMELFDDGIPTGKIAFLQIKGTKNRITPNATNDFVSCSVSISSLDYAKQNRIPFLLIYASTADPKEFYYVDMQSVIDEALESLRNWKPRKTKGGEMSKKPTSVTVHIPLANRVIDDMIAFFGLVNSYYEENAK